MGIAGLWAVNRKATGEEVLSFTMLTTEPGADVAPYHGRSIVPLSPDDGLDWLTLARPQTDILAAPAPGSLDVVTFRRDGVALGDDPARPASVEPNDLLSKME